MKEQHISISGLFCAVSRKRRKVVTLRLVGGSEACAMKAI